MFHCSLEGKVSILVWSNPKCRGRPIRDVSRDGCFVALDKRPLAFYKFKCLRIDEPDLRLSTAENMKNYFGDNCVLNGLRVSLDEDSGIGNNVDINIIIGLLSIVCIIGIIVGYLMQRRRRKH